MDEKMEFQKMDEKMFKLEGMREGDPPVGMRKAVLPT
jgi:hypothetical protein